MKVVRVLREDALREAMAIYGRVLENSGVSMKARSTTAVNLIFLCMRAGEREQARELVRSLPHIWESRELVLPEVYEGEEYNGALKVAARKALIFLCMKMDDALARKAGEVPAYVQLGVEFERARSTEEMLERIARFMRT